MAQLFQRPALTRAVRAVNVLGGNWDMSSSRIQQARLQEKKLASKAREQKRRDRKQRSKITRSIFKNRMIMEMMYGVDPSKW
jgi:hypothetical protein